MRVLIKLGGTLLDEAASRGRLAGEITQAASSGQYQIVVVHGGGKQMTRYLSERGIESRFINGLRVTTPEIIDAVIKVFAGSVNAQLVSALRAAGAAPVGLSGLDAGLVDAEILSSDLGQVGKPVHSDPRLLELLTGASYLPVVACIAGDASGSIYNVNADQMALHCAVSFDTEKLLFLTDVEGVRDRSGHPLESLRVAQARALIDDGSATGGMQAKLEAATEALERGVREVLIGPGSTPGVVRKMLSGIRVGTRVVP
jgi:acetylglutamate kinase